MSLCSTPTRVFPSPREQNLKSLPWSVGLCKDWTLPPQNLLVLIMHPSLLAHTSLWLFLEPSPQKSRSDLQHQQESGYVSAKSSPAAMFYLLPLHFSPKPVLPSDTACSFLSTVCPPPRQQNFTRGRAVWQSPQVPGTE